MDNNYPSASEVIRNLADIRTTHKVIFTEGPFRIVRFVPPYFEGSEFWVVSEKGFMWEPADSDDAALAYLLSDEAKEYIAKSGL